MPTKKVPSKPAQRPRKVLVKTGEDAVKLERVRRLCLALPDTLEKLSHGEPTFFVNNKVFAMFSDDHHGDGHVSVMIPAAEGEQAALIKAEPGTYYLPPYVGVKGWVGIELAAIGDEELAVHLLEAWKLIAAKGRTPRRAS